MRIYVLRLLSIKLLILIANGLPAMPFNSIEDISGLEKIHEVFFCSGASSTFSPNGRFFAFQSREFQEEAKLNVLDTDTWQLMNIGYHNASSDIRWMNDDILKNGDNFISLTAGAFIADSTQMVLFREHARPKVTTQEIQLYNIKGSQEVRLSDSEKTFLTIPDIMSFGNLRVSPSGNLVTFSGYPDESFKQHHNLEYTRGIFLYDRTNKRLKSVARTLTGLSSFSADERFLLYEHATSIHHEGNCENEEVSSLWIMDIASGEKKQLTDYELSVFYHLDWSANGLICFTRWTYMNQLSFYRLKLKEPEGTPTPK